MIDYTLPLEELPDPLPIEPLRKPFDVTITPPGSKSITCRAYVLAALAEGESRIIRPLRAEDTDHLLKALCTLGAEARWVPGGDDVLIKGVAGRFPRGGSVYLGDGGTPTRFMIACACLAAEPVIVDASPRMRERPIAEGVNMLRQLGAKIEYVEAEGRLPVRVVPSADFVGGPVMVGQTQSSQFISALMLIAPTLENGVDFTSEYTATSGSYVDLTLSILFRWDVKSDDRVCCQIRRQPLRAREFFVQPDASSAVYWWTAAAMHSNAMVRTPGIGGIPTQPDTDYARRVVRNMGARIWIAGDLEVFEMADTVVCIQGGSVFLPQRRVIDMCLMPDASISLGILATSANHPLKITGLRTLRVKETDRIAALANELRKIGCTVETGEDWISIDPSTRHDKPVVIDTYNDHRMAMAFAVFGLARPGISIRNPKCVAKSYPTFWKDFATLYQ